MPSAYIRSHPRNHGQPMSQMNVTPFIDVLLVLIIMLIMVVPLATHSIDIPLPTGPGKFSVKPVNTVSIDQTDRLLWNGQKLNRQDLLNQLSSMAKQDAEAVLRFEPDAQASYDMSAKTIALIKDSRVRNFAFIGNERYREFHAD